MQLIYSLFLVGSLISILCYKNDRLALKLGFGLCAAFCFYSMCYFVTNLGLTQSFSLGGHFLFAPKFMLNPLGNFFSFVVTFIGFASSVYALSYADEYIGKSNIGVFACLFNIFILAMLLVISANSLFCFIVLWEAMTIVSAFLILINDGKGTLRAVMIYLGIAQIGAFCLLCGIFLLSTYAGGSFDFESYKNLDIPSGMAAVIFILFLVGFGSKAGMWPLHVWLPLAHPAAPSNVSALMSGVMIKVALFALIKFTLYLPLSPNFGLTILVLGAASSLFGVLYALCQHDYKALLAYHSVENIGIILLGLGTGFYGLAIESAPLAAIGFLAGCYHTVNHAIFKALLFLCAGSVLRATHTRDMEVLGGLAKKMPYTAIGMFVGILGIAALPPVNGFVSEWFTYQGMLQGALSEGLLPRYLFSLSVVALALTGVLVGMHLKLYAVIFAGHPRDEKIYEKAKESPFAMIAGIMILVFGCFAFGIGAHVVTSYIMTSVNSIGVTYEAVSGFNINAAEPMKSFVSLPLITIVMISSMFLPFIILYVAKANRTPVRKTESWACGFKYSSRMQIKAAPFTGDLRRIMEWLFRAKPKTIDKGYFEPVEYHNHPNDIWWGIIFAPVIKLTSKIANDIGRFQNGYTNLYAAYILFYLCLVLGISYYLF